jgi:hypothetical protein
VDGEPLIRSQYLRSFAAALAVLGPGPEAEVRARARAELEALADASPLGFSPFASLLAIEAHVLEVAGEDGVRAVSSAAITTAVKAPFLGSVVQGALRLFGATPAALLRVMPRTWGAVTRDAGRFAIDVAGREARATARYEDVPDALLRSRAYTVGWEGFFQGLCQVAGRPGRAKVTRQGGGLVVDVAW